MQIAILIVSSASLVCSAGCLCIMLKGAKELKSAKTQIDTEIAGVKQKVERNKTVLKTALSNLQF